MNTPMDRLDFMDDQTCCLDGVPFTGVAVESFRGGKIRSEISFVDGMQSGVSRDWYETGVKKSEVEYCENNLHGRSLEWFPDGALKVEAAYERGVELSFTEWSEAGQKVVERIIEPGSVQYQLLQRWRNNG